METERLDDIGRCVYEDGPGLHTCPLCKKKYCNACYTMFLPIDAMFPGNTARICPSCHYNSKNTFVEDI